MANASRVGEVQTVLGLICGDELGITLPHEHLLVDLSCAFALPAAASQRGRAYEPVGIENLGWLRYPSFENLDNLRLLDEREAIDEALLFKLAGGNSIVDCTINGVGRDPELADAWYHVAAASGHVKAIVARDFAGQWLSPQRQAEVRAMVRRWRMDGMPETP